MNLYKAVRQFWRNRNTEEFKELRRNRMIQWRREGTTVRIDRPTRIDRARSLGYRAKPGYIIVRARVRRGSRRMSRPNRGRTGKNLANSDITSGRNLRWIAESRTARRFSNLEVLGSYWVGQDGRHKWFEIILVDPTHPSIYKDDRVSWIRSKNQRRRVYRGLTAAGKKARGLRNRGRGAEKARPSRNAHGNRNK